MHTTVCTMHSFKPPTSKLECNGYEARVWQNSLFSRGFVWKTVQATFKVLVNGCWQPCITGLSVSHVKVGRSAKWAPEKGQKYIQVKQEEQWRVLIYTLRYRASYQMKFSPNRKAPSNTTSRSCSVHNGSFSTFYLPHNENLGKLSKSKGQQMFPL